MRQRIHLRRDHQPSREDDLTTLPIAELQARIRRRQLRPSVLVEAHIARIRAVNPALNAVITDRFAVATAQAQAADARLLATADGELANLPPLFAIPCTVKEFFGIAGLGQTGGILSRRDVRASFDSTVVSRLHQAGAIIVGVTNIPEGGLWMETHNLLHGRTRNPWNLGRTCGGSSGGEGAIVAAGGVPFGIGSDVGGSIRIPAAFCGTVGHKPSGGLVPLHGHYPAPVGSSQFLVAGPLCRRVGDILPVLRAIAGPDGQDPTCEALPLGDPAAVDLRTVRILPLPRGAAVPVWPVMRQAIDLATAVLAERGASVEAFDPSLLGGGFWMWMAALTSASPHSYGDLLSAGQGIPLGRELLRLPFGRSRYLLPSLITVAAERLIARLPTALSDPRRQLDKLRRLGELLDGLLGDSGVIIYPPYSRPAPRHHLALLTPFDSACTSLWNVLGYAATVVPLGFSDAGLPVAVQVIARRGQDHLAIAVAAALEEQLGGWVRADPTGC